MGQQNKKERKKKQLFKRQAKSFYTRSGNSLIHLATILEWVTCGSKGNGQVYKILVFRIWNCANYSIVLERKRHKSVSYHHFGTNGLMDKKSFIFENFCPCQEWECVFHCGSLSLSSALILATCKSASFAAYSKTQCPALLSNCTSEHTVLKVTWEVKKKQKIALTKLFYITGNSFYKTHNKIFHC